MAYRESLTLKAKGLHTYSDNLQAVPEGSLQEAVNVVLDKRDLISPRRGYETLPGTISGNIQSLHSYTDGDQNNTLIAHRDNTTLERYNDGAETWTPYTGSQAAPSGANVIRSAEANKNFYFTTANGIQKLDGPTQTPVDAGAPRALDLTLNTAAIAAGSAVANNTTVGYRAVWGYKDLNNNLILGAPSSRLVYSNTTGGTVNPVVQTRIPAQSVTTIWFVQLYRTAEVSGTGDPGDEMQLVFETNPTATDLTNGYVEITDPTDPNLRGADLYTNATQEGLVNANFQPPQAVDMALFQNHMFYANTETKYSLFITLLATLSIGDTITINGVILTGAAAENVAANEFDVTHTGTPAQQIEATTRSIISVFNSSASNTALYGVYESTEDELPGQMRFFERDFGLAVDFTISSSIGSSFTPDLTTAETSTNEARPNRIFFSKIQEPEAVPLLNFFDVGPANDRILRILPLRSVLLIFTTRAIYRLTGTTQQTFQVTLLDSTARLLAAESLVPINNTATGFFDQGVCAVSGSSVQVLSRPIEGDLLTIVGAAKDKLAELSFGVAYESDRKYMVALPQSDTATINSIFYVYNTITNTWTTYDLSKSAGFVRPSDDKIYLAESGTISRERKDFSESDFSDEAKDITITAVSGDKLTLTAASVADVRVGDMYYESGAAFSIVNSVDAGNLQFTVRDSLDWQTGTFEIRPYITTTITWNPISAKTPNVLKQFAECTLIAETPVQIANLGFASVTSSGFTDVSISDTAQGPWGLFPWGEVPWGGDPIQVRYRMYIPRDKQKDAVLIPRLTQNTVFNGFEISGLSIFYRPISHKVSR